MVVEERRQRGRGEEEGGRGGGGGEGRGGGGEKGGGGGGGERGGEGERETERGEGECYLIEILCVRTPSTDPQEVIPEILTLFTVLVELLVT